MKKEAIFFIIFFFLTNALKAQFSESISSDRPGQSNSPNTLGKMLLQFQTGPQFEGANADNYENSVFVWPILVRFGIAEKVDVMTLLSYKHDHQKYFSFENTMNGINTVDFGLRFNIFEETANAPALGFEAFYKSEFTAKDYKPHYPSAKLNLMASKTFTDLFSMTSNLGLDVAGSDGGSYGFYTLNFVFAVSDGLSLFFENYGDFTYDNFNTYFDFGGAYVPNPDCQLDLYAGIGNNDDVTSYFVSLGFSRRIVTWRKE